MSFTVRDLEVVVLPLALADPADPPIGPGPECGWLDTGEPGCVTPSCACSDCGTCNSRGSCDPRSDEGSDEASAGDRSRVLPRLRAQIRYELARRAAESLV